MMRRDMREGSLDLEQSSSSLRARLAWSLPVFAVGLAFSAERILNSQTELFDVIPLTQHLVRTINPGIPNLDQALLGYALMLLASVAFALTMRQTLAATHGHIQPETHGSGLRFERPTGLELAALALSAAAWIYLLIRLSDKEHAWFHPLLLLLAIGVPAVILFRRDRASAVTFSIKIERWECLALLMMVAVSGAILTFDLTHTPDSMWGDEGGFWVWARDIGRGDRASNMFAPGVNTFPVAGSIGQAWFLDIFGYSLWSWRLSSVAAVVATLLPLYFLTRAMFDRTVAFGAVSLMIASPFLLAFGRMGYNNIQSLFPLVLSSLFVYAAVERRSAFLFFAAGLVAGFGFYTYYASRIAVFLCGSLVAHAWATKRLTPGEAAYGALLGITGALLMAVLPVIRLYAEHDPALEHKVVEGLVLNRGYVDEVFPGGAQGLTTVQFSGVDFVIDPTMWIRLLGRGVLRTLMAFHHNDMIEDHYISVSLGTPLISALLLPGLCLSIRWIRQPGFALLLGWTAIALITMSVVSTYPPNHPHLVVVIPALAITYALVLTLTLRSLARVLGQKWAFAAQVAVALVVAAVCVVGLREYFSSASSQFPPSLDIALWFAAEDIGEGGTVLLLHGDQHDDEYLPWGIVEFNLRERFGLVNATNGLQEDDLETVEVADVVFVDAREPELLGPATIWLDDWEFSSRREPSGRAVFWKFKRP
jgi:hypothetical protein